MFTVSLFAGNSVVVDDVGYASGPRLDVSAYCKCYCMCVFMAVPHAVVVLFQGTSIYNRYKALNCEFQVNKNYLVWQFCHQALFCFCFFFYR